MDKEGGVSMDDAAGFFANVFGGERFRDYVRAFRILLFLMAVNAQHSRLAKSQS